MMLRFLILFFITISSLFASESQEEPIIDCLRGVLLLGKWNDVRKTPVDDINGVEVRDVQLLGKNPQFLTKIYSNYCEKPLTQESISNLKKEIAQFYQSKNYPFVVVSIPKQELTQCVLQVVVEEATLGEIYSSGNCYFSSRWLSEEINVNPGDPIDVQTIYKDIAWLNLNPFRRTDAVFKPGNCPGTTDIELVTIDRWPYRVYVGADNTGTEATDRNRIFFGFNFGKSVLKDGQISYQFSSSPNWNLFYAHTASARLPLPWRHIAVLWGGYTQVEPDTGVPNMKNRGVSWQVDARYRFPIFIDEGFMQTVTVGYDFKETNNNILYNGEKIFNANADINQFMAGYEMGYRKKNFEVTFLAEIYGNPGGITYANQTSFYQLLRFGAKDRYAYIKMNHSLSSTTRWGVFSYDISGQASSTNLLPSEQFTMTGYNAVRGFEERILNLDNALIVNLAYETPRFSPLKTFFNCRRRDEFYLLAFFDYGLGGNHDPENGEDPFKSLASVGPGARYQIDRYFTVRFDYGFQLWHDGFQAQGDSRYNFGLVLSY